MGLFDKLLNNKSKKTETILGQNPLLTDMLQYIKERIDVKDYVPVPNLLRSSFMFCDRHFAGSFSLLCGSVLRKRFSIRVNSRFIKPQVLFSVFSFEMAKLLFFITFLLF